MRMFFNRLLSSRLFPGASSVANFSFMLLVFFHGSELRDVKTFYGAYGEFAFQFYGDATRIVRNPGLEVVAGFLFAV